MLESIWFFLWGLLWAVYFMLDGFDLGLGTLMPVLAKDERDRRHIFNAMGPFWDGNEVWLITAGGVTFAAFPDMYATMFSALYTPLMLILFALILRGIAFEFRGKFEHSLLRSIWDGCMVVGSFLPALLFGVAFANIFSGIPIDEQGVYQGSLLTLLNPYGLCGGLLFVLLFLVHGSLWMAIKSEGDLQERSISTASKLWFVLVAVAMVFLIASEEATELYGNYRVYPILYVIPVLAVTGLMLMRIFLFRRALWNLVCILPCDCRMYLLWCRGAVSESFAFQSGPGLQPDHNQRILQPVDSQNHAGCNVDFRANRHSVSDVGVSSLQR